MRASLDISKDRGKDERSGVLWSGLGGLSLTAPFLLEGPAQFLEAWWLLLIAAALEQGRGSAGCA